MKKFIFCILVVLYILPVFSQDSSKDIIPFFSYSTFYSPEHGSYVETYLTILGHSLYFSKTNEGSFESKVEVTILIKQDQRIVDFKKINLKSPEIQDTLSVNFSLVDVQRFALPDGTYDIEVKLTDINSPIEPLYILDAVTLDYDPDVLMVSGIQLIERYQKSTETNIFTKAGYELVPLPLNFFPKIINSLTFYCEIYNTDKKLGQDEPFLIKTHIEQFETKKIAHNLQTFKREKAGNVHSFMHEFDISGLPSGNYVLVVEVRDKNNDMISSNQLFFQRSNPPADTDFMEMNLTYTASFVNNIQSADTLREYIRSVRPIATENEKYFIDKSSKVAETDRLKQFFYIFWAERSNNPLQAWSDYRNEVHKVQNSFGTKIKKGYETDRGRVYLQYGAPNTIVSEDREPSTYPYEIWHYYQLNNQRNRKFVFYNRDLVTNDYELIHSDALGEIQDYQWQIKLNQRNFATNDPDLQKSDWGWGSRVDDYWRNPR